MIGVNHFGEWEVVAMPEFQPGQRVRVRDEGGDPDTQPDKSVLGKEGTIRYGHVLPLDGGPPMFYMVEFDIGEVESISPDWLEPT